MKTELWKQGHRDRRYFIGGSDARIIMGNDEASCCGCGRKSEVKLNRRIFQAI